MKILILSDQRLDLKKLKSVAGESAYYFSLTSDKKVNDFNIKQLDNLSSSLEVLPSANYVNNQADKLGDKLEKIRLEYSRKTHKKELLIDQFIIDKNISTYYFTELVERNVYKYQYYKLLAQFDAIKYFLDEKGDIDLIIYSIKDEKLEESIETLDISVENLKNKKLIYKKLGKKLSLMKQIIKGIMMGFLYISRLLFYFLVQKFYAHSNNFTDDNKIKIISYFPYIDSEEEKKGKFNNLYYLPLQEHLLKDEISHSWLLIYAKIKGNSYMDSSQIAKRIISDKHLFLEGLLSIKTILRISVLWLSHSIKYLFLRRHFFGQKTESRSIEEIYAQQSLDNSYFGLSVLSGIAYYYQFRSYAKTQDSTKLVIYLNEMQTWERAFNASFLKYQPNIKRIGYQHSSVAKRIFHYYSERTQESKGFSEPLPDYFAVNGKIPKQELTKSYGDKIITLEALRQLQTRGQSNFRSKKNVKDLRKILYIGSYDRYEAIKILDFVSEAAGEDFNTEGNITQNGEVVFAKIGLGVIDEVIVKPHPSCDLTKEVRIRDTQIETKMSISNDNLDDILPNIKFVIVGSSTAAIDAVRNNCKIYVPVFSDHIILSPLSGYDDFFTYVSEPRELIRSIDDWTDEFSDDYSDPLYNRNKFETDEESERKIKEKFIEDFWLLEKSLSKWKDLISRCLK